jgi:hypothetical protein
MIKTEAQLSAYVSEQASSRGLLAYHLDAARRRFNSSSVGFPDWVIAGPSGILFRELKSQDGRITPDQRYWGDILNYAGGNWGIWRPDDAASGIICAELDALTKAWDERATGE